MSIEKVGNNEVISFVSERGKRINNSCISPFDRAPNPSLSKYSPISSFSQSFIRLPPFSKLILTHIFRIP
ncbi:MAG: hypothetical protein DWB56_04525 [Candidatus Jettenia sp.]|uniref:Uncharacterized protein n=1 Tax=Candidatus Jettenia caeni TaxID=247490 RepID=I3IIJ9_9BACT|nr:MAG: hypothetical protein EDM77_07060 [Candidatus Jettenia sp. AMX1]MBC6928220.1 hypothetical protein [Candidatus Jettenia sp.]MCE7880499.1 hypothetical protein [Candidatus Jettenia sp. AMX1]MCQ3926307.1 hypothetical protein [Candidatus Jettenia sp.]GAB61544.1 hypothetical protein KSU1_B0687 [Candidatus Jettenia caeni]